MDESELVKWMRQVESRLRVLEGEPASTAAQTQPSRSDYSAAAKHRRKG